jgi:hypothetical protein
VLFNQGDKEQRKRAAEAVITRNGGKIERNTLRSVVIYPHPGIKMLGVIDYLVNFHGYLWSRV